MDCKLLLLFLLEIATVLACLKSKSKPPPPSPLPNPRDIDEHSTREPNWAVRLQCQPDYIRSYHYENAVKLWGSTGNTLITTAIVNSKCITQDGGLFTYVMKLHQMKTLIEVDENGTTMAAPSLVSQWHNRNEDAETFLPSSYPLDANFSRPFIVTQSFNGSIVDIFFHSDDDDPTVRNVKRHIAESFYSHFDTNQLHQPVKETSTIGTHNSLYSMRYKAGGAVLLERQIDSSTLSNSAILKGGPGFSIEKDVNVGSRGSREYQNGHLVASEGTLTLQLFKKTSKKRKREVREPQLDASDVLALSANYSLTLMRIHKRSVHDETLFGEGLNYKNFYSSSLITEMTADKDKLVQHLTNIIHKLGDIEQSLNAVLEESYNDSDSKYFSLKSIISLERKTHVTNKSDSVSTKLMNLIQQQTWETLCSHLTNACWRTLDFASMLGGAEIEKIFFNLTDPSVSWLTFTERSDIAKLMVNLPDPSHEFLLHLVRIVQQKETWSPSLMLATTGLLSKASKKTSGLRQAFAHYLLDRLAKEAPSNCGSCHVCSDLWESLGNLGHEDSKQDLLALSKHCSDSAFYQVGIAHALRKLLKDEGVQVWYKHHLEEGMSCDVMKAVLSVLTDEINTFKYNMYDNPDNWESLLEWPLYTMNDVDHVIVAALLDDSTKYECVTEELHHYIASKEDPEAKAIVEKLEELQMEENLVKNVSVDHTTFAKLQVKNMWTSSTCSQWGPSSYYGVIQSAGEFHRDQEVFDQRKHCLGFKHVGIDNAMANIYAGIFTGRERTKGLFKVFFKLAATGIVWDRPFDIGSLYFYRGNDEGDSITRFYVKVGGITVVEYVGLTCRPIYQTKDSYYYVPIVDFTVWMIKLSVGLEVRPEMIIDLQCPTNGVVQIEPRAAMRVAGEASAAILGVEASLTLGGNLNYYVNFEVDPSPGLCLSSYHGNDDMGLSIEAKFRTKEYQMHCCPSMEWVWGKWHSWRPSSLSWDIGGEARHLWMSNECLIKK